MKLIRLTIGCLLFTFLLTNKGYAQDKISDTKITIYPKQTQTNRFGGLGFEIQSDAIGSGNNGLPEEKIAVPHDLDPF